MFRSVRCWPTIVVLLFVAGCGGSKNGANDLSSDASDMAVVGGDDGGADLAGIAADDMGSGDLATGKTLSFAAPVTLMTTNAEPDAIRSGDFTGDGKADLLVQSWSGIVNSGGGALDVLISNGDGTFAYNASLMMTSGTMTPFTVGRYDSDAKADLAQFYATCTKNPKTGVTTCTPYLVVGLSNGDGTFSTTSSPPAPTSMSSLQTADLNGDGVVDFVSDSTDAANAKNGFTVYLNNGTANALTKTDYLSPTYPAQTSDVVVADLNADGRPDIFYGAQNAVVIVMNNGNGTFATPTSLTTSSAANKIAFADDFNGDHRPDLVIGHDTQTFTVYMSIASGGFAQPNDYTAGIVATTAASGDFDGDGLPDVVLCDGSNLAFFINQGNGFKTPVVIAQACGSLAVGDFNGDALADVATASGLQRAAYVIMNTTH